MRRLAGGGRGDAGTTLHQGTDGTGVAFEADGPSGIAEPTWSVVVHGGREVLVPSGPLMLPRGRW